MFPDGGRVALEKLLPDLDFALSALLEDLDARGLLETTLVLVMGEFGRTPRIGQVVMITARLAMLATPSTPHLTASPITISSRLAMSQPEPRIERIA